MSIVPRDVMVFLHPWGALRSIFLSLGQREAIRLRLSEETSLHSLRSKSVMPSCRTLCVCACLCVCVHACVGVHMCVWVCVCGLVHAYTGCIYSDLSLGRTVGFPKLYIIKSCFAYDSGKNTPATLHTTLWTAGLPAIPTDLLKGHFLSKIKIHLSIYLSIYAYVYYGRQWTNYLLVTSQQHSLNSEASVANTRAVYCFARLLGYSSIAVNH